MLVCQAVLEIKIKTQTELTLYIYCELDIIDKIILLSNISHSYLINCILDKTISAKIYNQNIAFIAVLPPLRQNEE